MMASGDNPQKAADAANALLNIDQKPLIRKNLLTEDETRFDNMLQALVNTGADKAKHVFSGAAHDSRLSLERRGKVVRAKGKIFTGAYGLIWWVENDKYDHALKPYVSAALHSAPWPDIAEKAQKLFPLPPSKGSPALPSIGELVKLRGDVVSGQKVFAGVGTCAKCHIVAGKGQDVGPDLS